MSVRSFCLSYFLLFGSRQLSLSLTLKLFRIYILQVPPSPFTPLFNLVRSLSLLFNYLIYSYKSWDSSVSTVTWQWAELLRNFVWIPGRAISFVSLIQYIHTGSEDQQVACSSTGNFRSSYGEGETEDLPHRTPLFSTGFKNVCLGRTSLPHTLSSSSV